MRHARQRRRSPGWTRRCPGTARCRPRTGPGSAWSPRPASPPSSSGSATPRRPQAITADVFGTAPRELARAVTLQQTVELVRVDDRGRRGARSTSSPRPATRPMLREAVLRYTREIAFAAAQVYAQAAEARGAWDARLEALVVDALLRGEADDALRSRAAALGWGRHDSVVVVVGHDAGRRARGGGRRRSARSRARRAPRRADRRAGRPAGRGPRRRRRPAARRPATWSRSSAPGRSWSARRCPTCSRRGHGPPPRRVAGLRAAAAWPDAPRPVLADDLLPERALAGDPLARAAAGATTSTGRCRRRARRCSRP